MFFQIILIYLLDLLKSILEKVGGHPPFQSNSYYFNNLDKALDLYSHCDKKQLVGFLFCFFTNNSLSFQNRTTTFTGLSDYDKLVLTVLKSLPKDKPKEVFYRDYKESRIVLSVWSNIS